ncbi:hypothetical protein D3C84_974910 [compost metagenome]
MAKQFAFHKLGSERRAVDSDAGLLRALAPAVNCLRQLALPRSGLPEDQDVGIGTGHLASRLEHDFHRRAVGVQSVLGFTYLTFQRLQTRR